MVKKKQTAAIALSLGLLFTSVPYSALADTPAAASAVLTQDQAVAIATKTVPIPEGFKLRDASLHEIKGQEAPWGSTSIWNLNFAKDESRYEQGWINITMDAKSGTILNFDNNQRDDSSIENGLSREEAKAKAEEFLKKFAADKAAQVKEMDGTNQYGYYGPGPNNLMQVFRFVRLVNGIPYPMDGITIRLNNKGELRGYSYSWSDSIQFPAASAAVTQAQAKDTFKDSLNLQLQYQREYKQFGASQDARLVYAPWEEFYGAFGSQFPMIDASTGRAIRPDGKPIEPKQAPEFKPVADKPGEPVTTKEITKDVAQELIKRYNINTDGYNLQGSGYSSNNGPDGSYNTWQFNYSKGDSKDPKSMQNINVSIDAKTGELRSFNRYGYMEGPQQFPANPAISEEAARQKAIDFVKQALPTKANQLAINVFANVKGNFKMGPSYGFQFVRLVNGVPMRDNSIQVAIDPSTGEIREFYAFSAWQDNINYPSKDKAIGLDAAKDKYVSRYNLQLQYVPIYPQGKTPYESGKPNTVALVYAPVMSGPLQVLNAIDGEWVSLQGPPAPGTVKPEDIKGHWAEKQLQFLVDRGIFTVKDGKLNPDTAVTRGDMVNYLVSLISGPQIMKDSSTFTDVPKTDPNFDFIEEAAARKWIDKNTKQFRPADKMNREELADIVTAILGYSKLSDAPDTFKNHFKDVTQGKYTGDVAIVSALGIMTGNDGLFSPRGEVTKAQAAAVMTRLLDQLKEKQPEYAYYISK